jgi:CheY-like chemotaxis protein
MVAKKEPEKKAALVSVSVANGAHLLVVLVVEDEYFVRFNIATRLRDEGYVVIETASGEEAIALCQSGTSIDIVFTDINLIGPATGWDVAECFRIERSDVAVLYTSGKSVDAQRRVPGSEFVAKPYKSTDILNALQRLHTA